jgi:signal peptidase II
MNKYAIFGLGTAGAFLADQYTKWQIVRHFDLHEAAPILHDRLALNYVQNRGAAFGFFSDFGRVFFLGISLVAVAFILYFFWKVRPDQKLIAASLSLIFGGALGNLYDRFVLGYVVDFVEITIHGRLQWPTFNVADVAICAGVAVLMIELLTQRPEEPPAESPAAS